MNEEQQRVEREIMRAISLGVDAAASLRRLFPDLKALETLLSTIWQLRAENERLTTKLGRRNYRILKFRKQLAAIGIEESNDEDTEEETEAQR